MSSHPTDEGPEETPGRRSLSAGQLRELLSARFATAGYALESEHTLQQAGVALTVDAYDPRRRAGFLVRELDPWTGEDTAAALRPQDLGLLVVHPADIPSVDVLERRLDAFFAALSGR